MSFWNVRQRCCGLERKFLTTASVAWQSVERLSSGLKEQLAQKEERGFLPTLNELLVVIASIPFIPANRQKLRSRSGTDEAIVPGSIKAIVKNRDGLGLF